jgi:hypothetical protein
MLKRFLCSLPVLVCVSLSVGQQPTETRLPPPPPPPPSHPALESAPKPAASLGAKTIVVLPNITASCCCGKKPSYDPRQGWVPPFPWTNFTGQIAIITQENNNDMQPLSTQGVVIWNLTGESTAPVGALWSAPQTQYYSDPRWNTTNLGEVFGLTLDNQGNIYVAGTAIYGAPGNSNIYKIANGTGTPSLFATLPHDNAVPNGIGNIAYCVHDSLFASDFYDGLIYRLDASGNTVSTWDHGVNLPTATPSRTLIPAVPKDGNSTYTALGRRPWAVRVCQNRLFYSIWSEDDSRNPNFSSPGIGPNEIWSVALNGAGDPVVPARLEITLPPAHINFNNNYSNPVSDIAFTATGNMLVSERSMASNSGSNAHSSRLIEFFPIGGGGWGYNTSFPYLVGEPAFTHPSSSAGGVDFDFTPGARFPVWGSGDALAYHTGNYIYGIQGFPSGGGNTTNSLLIDDDNYTQISNKKQIGDVKIPCPDCTTPPPAPVITGPQSMCALPSNYVISNPQAGVTYTWSVTGGTPSATTGAGISVNWANTGPGSITVTTSGPAGCTAVTSTIPVTTCNSCSYCKNTGTNATLPVAPSAQAGGLYTIQPKITSLMTGVSSITETLLSTSISYTPASCGQSSSIGPAYISQALPATGFPTVTLPVPNGNQAVWQTSSPAALSSAGVSTPVSLQLPPAPALTNPSCSTSFSFCMSFSLTNPDCLTCSVIRCFGPYPYVHSFIKNR